MITTTSQISDCYRQQVAATSDALRALESLLTTILNADELKPDEVARLKREARAYLQALTNSVDVEEQAPEVTVERVRARDVAVALEQELEEVRAQAERDRATVGRVEALAEWWERVATDHLAPAVRKTMLERAGNLRAALMGPPEPDSQ